MLSFVILHSKRCLEYLQLQFTTPRMQGHGKVHALVPKARALAPNEPPGETITT